MEQFGTEGRTLRVTNDATEISTDVPGTIQTVNEQTSNDAFHGRRFSASLPAGNYTAQFYDEEGQLAPWPTYAEETRLKAPNCRGSANAGDVTLIKPALVAETGGARRLQDEVCGELVRNGGQGLQLDTSERN